MSQTLVILVILDLGSVIDRLWAWNLGAGIQNNQNNQSLRQNSGQCDSGLEWPLVCLVLVWDTLSISCHHFRDQSRKNQKLFKTIDPEAAILSQTLVILVILVLESIVDWLGHGT